MSASAPSPMDEQGGSPQGGGGGVSQYTAVAIHALHDAIAHEPDPEDKAIMATCLQQLLRVQAKNMKQESQPSGPPQGAMPAGQGGGNPLGALLGRMAGGQ